MGSGFDRQSVMFNEYMRWDETVQMIAKKLSKVVGIIYKHRKTLPQSVLRLLYNSLLYSCFNYCFLVWGNTNFANIHRVHILQKKVVRILCNEAHDSHTAPFFKKLGIVPITNHYEYKLALAYKAAINHPGNSLLSLSSLHSQNTSYATRHADARTVPRSRTNYGNQMVRYQLPKMLNYFLSRNITIENCSNKRILSLLVS